MKLDVLEGGQAPGGRTPLLPEQCYLYPLSPSTLQQAQGTFSKLVGSAKSMESSVVIPVMMGRQLTIPRSGNGAAFFNFEELCGGNGSYLGAPDYMAVASKYHTLVLCGVPQLSLATRDLARRFILLIDQLYNAKCRLVIQAMISFP